MARPAAAGVSHVHEPGARTACARDMRLHRGTLRVQTQPATALLIGADAGAGEAGRAYDARSGGSASLGSGGLPWPARARISDARPALERAARAAK